MGEKKKGEFYTSPNNFSLSEGKKRIAPSLKKRRKKEPHNISLPPVAKKKGGKGGISLKQGVASLPIEKLPAGNRTKKKGGKRAINVTQVFDLPERGKRGKDVPEGSYREKKREKGKKRNNNNGV